MVLHKQTAETAQASHSYHSAVQHQAMTAVGLSKILLGSLAVVLGSGFQQRAIATPRPAFARSPLAYTFPLRRNRLPDLLQGLQQGKNAFLVEAQKGGFIALTGVQPRQPIWLLEGATYSIAEDNSITFTLADGTLVPPISRAGYEAIKNTLPAHQQAILDDKFFWHLQRNPAIPLIAAGLAKGEYREFISHQVFDTDAYYLKPFLGHLFWAAQKADVPLQAVLPLLETHLLTLEFPYLRETDLATRSGAVRSFYRYEQELTNKQYLLRSLLATPVEPWARLEAIKQIEGSQVKQDYTDAESTSTTIAIGRLPLPTPTAAEDTPAVHALNIAEVAQQGIDLFPDDLEQAALEYRRRYKHKLAQEAALKLRLRDFAERHHSKILTSIDNYYSEDFWLNIGLTEDLSRKSVNQMDTSRLVGIFATRFEMLNRASAAESYPDARAHFIKFFQQNSPNLSETELLTVLLCDQVFNPWFWKSLPRRQPELALEVRALQKDIQALETQYTEAAAQEAEVFRLLQHHDLDITTEALSLLSVAMAKRLSGFVDATFQPGDRRNSDYLDFTRALYPFIRDMPDLNMMWGNGDDIKRFGLDNYVVPDLMALTAADSPTLAAMGALWYKMVSNNDLDRWDVNKFMKLLNTGYNLSSNHPPTKLPAEQVAMLPLVDRYRPELKRVTGADGSGAPTVLHGRLRLDFRIANWPRDRDPNPPRINRVDPAALQQIFPDLSPEDINNLIWKLSNHSGEISLSIPLILLTDPVFVGNQNGAIDLLFELDGEQMVFPEISRHFKSIYSPAYMARIALPQAPSQADIDALNQVIRQTHALYGGYTAQTMSLPAPLQSLQRE